MHQSKSKLSLTFFSATVTVYCFLSTIHYSTTTTNSYIHSTTKGQEKNRGPEKTELQNNQSFNQQTTIKFHN